MTPLFWTDLTFEWYEDGMVFYVFIFLSRINGKKGHLDENNFRHYYGHFFQKWHSECFVITVMFKVPSQQIRGTLTTASWKIAYSSLFYGHGPTCVLDLSSRLLWTSLKRESMKVPGKRNLRKVCAWKNIAPK